MKNIFIANFDGVDIRFVNVDDDIFVSQSDFVLAVKKCFTDDIKHLAHLFVSGGVKIIGDKLDSRSVILGDSAIGPAIHFHALGNFLTNFVELSDTGNPSLRESCFRLNSFSQWYSSAVSDADVFFGRGVDDLLDSVMRRLDRFNAPYTVEVFHDSDVWVASCDDLGLVTEAPDYESLTERVWEIAGDLIEANQIENDIDSIRLSFVQTQVSDNRVAL